MFTEVYVRATMVLPEAPCLRSNNTFSPLTPILNRIEGAFGSLLLTLSPLIAVLLFVAGLVMVFTQKGSFFFKLAVWAAFVPFAAIVVLQVADALLYGTNGMTNCR